MRQEVDLGLLGIEVEGVIAHECGFFFFFFEVMKT